MEVGGGGGKLGSCSSPKWQGHSECSGFVLLQGLKLRELSSHDQSSRAHKSA